tara:strand:- start:412 stop:1740 length:1329 start_codon:yes stop_codon:yes gene_type:complete
MSADASTPPRDADHSPVAPGAPVAKRMCIRRKGIAPVNNVTAVLQFGKIGLDTKVNMEMLVKSNADEIAETLAFTLCLDVSFSMGNRSSPNSPISLLAKFLDEFLTNGMPGKRIFLRLITFGQNVHVMEHNIAETPLLELTDETRPLFLSMIKPDVLNGIEGRTNISGAVSKAIELSSAYQSHKSVATKIQHVVCLTDGVANMGTTKGDDFLEMVKNAIGYDDTYVHYIGLGEGVNEEFMDTITDKGKVGVFAVAPNASAIPEAYEKVFGYVTGASGSFDVCIRSAEGTNIARLGMLIREREALVPVVVPPSAIEGTFPVVYVSMTKNGKIIGDEIALSITYARGVVRDDERKEVKDAVQEREVEAERERIMMNAKDLKTAHTAMEEAQVRYRSLGYSDKAIKKSQDDSRMVKRASEDERWCSLSGRKGARMMCAEMSSQPY